VNGYDRAISAISTVDGRIKVEKWWGRPDWASLKGLGSYDRAETMRARFENELGYNKATMYPIHNQQMGGRIMFYMIHASDHPDALPLMVRAYRAVSGRRDLGPKYIQQNLPELVSEIQHDNRPQDWLLRP